MQYDFNILSAILLLATVAGIVTVLLAWKQRKVASAKYLILLEIVVSEWALAAVFEAAATTLPLKIFWSQVSYLGIVCAPVAYLLFAIAYSQYTKFLTMRNVFYLSTIPAVTLIMVFTNSWHNLHWTSVIINPINNIAFYNYGPFFWIFTGFSYILLSSGIILLIRAIIRFNPKFKSQAILIIAGSIFPFLGNIVYIFDLNPIQGLDWTPISFMASGLFLTLGILQYDLFKLTPVARDKLFRMINDGIIVLSPDWLIVDMNLAMQQRIGKTTNEIIGKPIDEVLAEWKELIRDLQTNFKEQTELHIELDGKQYYFDLQLTHLYNRLGQITGHLAIIHEITVRKMAEKQLLNNQLLLNATLNSTADGILVVNNNGEVVFNNQRFGELWKIPNEILETQDDSKLLDYVLDQLSDPSTFLSKVRELYTTKKESFDTIDFKDGRVFERYSSPLMENQEVKGRVWSFRDVTEHQSLINILQSERDRFQTYLDITEVMIVVIGADQKVELINNKGCEILGQKHEDIIGQNWFDNFIPTESKKHVKTVFNQIISGELTQNIYYENSIINNQGEERMIAWHNALIYGADNKILGTISSGEDVTEKKIIEQQREQALVEAQKANSVKTLFLANMSHEIRTPLNSINGFTNLLRGKLADSKDKELVNYTDIIQNSSERLLRTVHEILDLSQIEAGVFTCYLNKTDLIQIINQAIDQLSPAANEKNLRLIFSTALKEAPVKVDKLNIINALLNLIDNAIKYTDTGQITVELDESKNDYILIISDTGIGIAKDYLDKMYDAFSQESSGYTKKYQGLGLGLTITKKYLELNKVGLSASSTKGEGTVFTLTFPRLSEPKQN